MADKLKWDETALHLALQINDEEIKSIYPSLYLNIAKGYEDLKEFEQARKNYELALSFARFLPGDGYGQLIQGGIRSGLKRIENERERSENDN